MKTKSKHTKRNTKSAKKTARLVPHAVKPAPRDVAHVYRGKSRRRSRPATPPAPTMALLPAPGVEPPRYDKGLGYNTGLRYVVDDPPPPTGKAKVKLELQSRSDANLVGFGHSHEEAIDTNPSFPTPQPTKIVFSAKLTELEAALAELENHRVTGKALTERRDVLRAEFELLFVQRGTYVELASGGNPEVIMSAGLPVRNPPSPTGILPYPGNLRVDLNNVAGQMKLRWMSVTGARAYMVEMAEVVNGVPGEYTLVYTGGKFSHLLSGMIIGKTYAFRVCSVGGEGGRSAWSPDVWRAAA